MRPSSRVVSRLWLSLAATITLTTGMVAHADDIVLPAATSASPSVTTPARGINMASVEAKFGAPAERHAAVGNPPITRWDYPSFSVFFEHEHVVHAVVH